MPLISMLMTSLPISFLPPLLVPFSQPLLDSDDTAELERITGQRAVHTLLRFTYRDDVVLDQVGACEEGCLRWVLHAWGGGAKTQCVLQRKEGLWDAVCLGKIPTPTQIVSTTAT